MQLIFKPGELLLSEHGSFGVVVIFLRNAVHLRVASCQSFVEHDQVNEFAVGKIPIQLLGFVFPNGEPFIVSLACSRFSDFIVAFFIGLVVLCARLIGIVADLVVVPDGNKGLHLMGELEIRIQSVLRVSGAVILQRYEFLVGKVVPSEGSITIHANGILVDVVA